MKYIANSFSFDMVKINHFALIRAKRIFPEEIPEDVESAVDHVDTAKVISGLLGFDVPANRMDVHLKEGDVLYVAQYYGPCLPEGATKLPKGATIEFLEITIKDDGCKGCRTRDCTLCARMVWAHGII